MVRLTFPYAPWLASAWLFGIGVLVGCGGSGSGTQATPPADAGAPPSATSAAHEPKPDAASDLDAGSLGDGGVSCVEGGAGPKGKLLVKSSTAAILGLTDDDQVVYAETSNTLFAVASTGGPAASIGPTEGSARLAGKAVFRWTGLNQDGTVGGLAAWTAAGGSRPLATTSLAGIADSSADSSKVVYFDNASASAADLYVAGIDGSGKAKLASGIAWSQNCMPDASFLGSSIVLGYCTATPAGTSTPVGTLVLYLGPNGTAKTLSTSAVLSFQSSGTVLLFSAPEGLVLADATTGSTTLIDPAGGTEAALTHDAQSAVYLAKDGSIKRSPLAPPHPTTLVTGGFQALSSLSPDGRWLLASKARDPNTGNGDVYIASATTAGFATAILGTPTGTFYGSPFTADSSRVLYVDNAMLGAGDYHIAPTTGGAGSKLASRVWIGLATSGTSLVFQDGFVAGIGPQMQGTADIESVDVSSVPPSPTLLVNQADPGLYFTSAGDRIVYSLSTCANGSEGIWVMPTP